MMRMKKRNQKGQAIAEMAGILLLLFLFLTFPLMNLAAIGLRTCFIISSAKVAAHKASKSLTYLAPANIPAGIVCNNTPAVQVAKDTVANYLKPFSGVKVVSVNVGIMSINDSTGSKVGPVYQPISSGNTYGNTYYLDVDVIAEADPLLTCNANLIGSIPGLTRPLRLVTHGQRVFENPKGLSM